MGGVSSLVSRVRSGGTHRSTLVTSWKVRVSGIEFVKDYPMRENGNNHSNKGSDAIVYPKIRENFKGWGLGPYLAGWDWEGSDNLKRVACYRREMPISMRVRLSSSHPAPSDRTFTLQVEPTVKNGAATPLTPSSVHVSWPAGSREQIVEVTIGGKLPNEVSRYDLHLTWSARNIAVSTPGGTPGAGVGGVINRSRHTIYSIYEDPLKPSVSNKSGSKWWVDTGLTKQRLDKLLLAFGGHADRFPTPAATDIDRLIWQLHQHVNDSSPPYFNGARGAFVMYGQDGPKLDYLDQWVMWLASRTWNRAPREQPHWNFGACITYVQLMKTMLAMAGINAQRAWVYPKTTVWPNGIDVDWDDSDLVDVEDVDPDTADDLEKYLGQRTKPQDWTFLDKRSGLEFKAEVRLIDKPAANGDAVSDHFEACLYYGGKLVPGAIPTRRYPANVLQDRVGFANATELLRWWHSVKHGNFRRFMAWVSDSPVGYLRQRRRLLHQPLRHPGCQAAAGALGREAFDATGNTTRPATDGSLHRAALTREPAVRLSGVDLAGRKGSAGTGIEIGS